MAKVTLQSIADEIGVSRMTVSNAFSRPDKLSADLRERILAMAEELGYVGPDPAARALARGRTGTVGLLISGRLGEQAADPVAIEFLVAVADALSDHGLALTLITAGVGGETIPARDVPMDGVLVYVCEPDSTDLAWLRRRDLPLVTVDQQALPDTPSINVDDRAGARAAAQHVVDLGHRRIGLLNLQPEQGDAPGPAAPDAPSNPPPSNPPPSNPPPSRLPPSNPPAAERDKGWRDALSEAGIEPVVELSVFRPVTAAYDAARLLLERPDRPTAVLCFSDGFAAQAIRAAESLGLRVPEDVSIVGFDDSSLATAVNPPLTTVSQPVTEKGRLAVAALVAVLRPGGTGVTEAAAEPARTLLPTSLVVRGSTGPPPA